MNHWSTHQLTEFFAAVCARPDEAAATSVAVERATEVLEAEVGAVLRDGRVDVAWGISADKLSGLSENPVLDLPGIGELHVASARFGGGTLLVGRADEALGPEERQLLQAMAQVLGLALDNLTLLTAERRQAAERLALLDSLREARHDSLTGLPTRVLFLEKLREAGTASVLFIDLDRFKAVNDSLGHRAGDDLLGLVAARIRSCIDDGDVPARIGGDEFAVLLRTSRGDEAVAVARRLIDAVRRPFRVAGRDVFIGASIGIATGAGSSADDLLGNADVAMYRAKKDGPGKVVVFEPHMHAQALARLNLDGDLQRALELGQFRLQYQPLIRLGSGTTYGVEALIRWHKPRHGYALTPGSVAPHGAVPVDVAAPVDFVSPADFVPMAEETGLIIDIGRWVLNTAGDQAARWRTAMPDLRLNVNVSGRQLTDPLFVADVERMLARTGLPAEAVTCELTESVLMNDPAVAIACLGELRSLGVGVSIDDFGTGYSSLSYLRRLPVDELKIDRAFIGEAVPSREDLAVVRAVVELGRTLKLRTVIEGVETEEQRRAMRRLGCDLGQGYHLCRPADPERIPGLLFEPIAA
ncbi:diguanylate cyclase (GGDEF)-like protein [Actinoplanes lutulentus]|uniref:Diguanylate cyclase (GGDEF)-like protein n=1 Tax=Actinoplanes lutulentus TaxID=1287878 RepID=A0A327YXL4_9ACTN|nr:EAL domain-containing protein [Actinoplanes lutulentus]MBB2948945.1 diguanylate cyclase (GGDEF)-like protein [Actinoplanes lutulentus]RAK26272.1 diguanylate cyclase (GGDEF)-like protein [Actinoplanes lutulentus]